MKKLAIMMALVATLVSNGAYAQNNNNKNMNNNNRNMNNNTGSAAQQGTYNSGDNLAWGIGLGGLAIIGVVVGVTVAGAVSTQPTFSH